MKAEFLQVEDHILFFKCLWFHFGNFIVAKQFYETFLAGTPSQKQMYLEGFLWQFNHSIDTLDMVFPKAEIIPPRVKQFIKDENIPKGALIYLSKSEGLSRPGIYISTETHFYEIYFDGDVRVENKGILL